MDDENISPKFGARSLRSGFTTGACAQAAAKGSALLLLNQKMIYSVEVELPNKEMSVFTLIDQEFERDYARCAVIKDAGDDNDITDGIKIYCEIRKSGDSTIAIKGGKGVGIVTKPGLAVPVGEHAINPVPRKMIDRDVGALLSQDVGFVVEISAPEGVAIAEKTFNPRLGIKGGISIIGTTGIVEPKSKEAYMASLALEINVVKASDRGVVFLASGYIGEDLLKNRFGVDDGAIIKIGDHVGFMLHECVKRDIEMAVLVGHIGKLAKVAAGLFNTHSKTGDARLETIAAYAASCGASSEIVNRILGLELSEQAVEILRENNIMPAFDRIAKRVVERSVEYCRGKMKISCIILSLNGDILGTEPLNLLESEEWKRFISLA